ncbi:MAG TPA: helix-turn-helix transcriptional regulator [bacterium]|nr:helix-turn-helix transcriptional regulator [bacterium]
MEPIEIRQFRKRIAQAIRKLRAEEGITAKHLAKVLGVTQPTISRIEAGTASISGENLCFLARSFNRPLSFFVGEQSPVHYEEEDILRAGLVQYGARHLKSKRTIEVSAYYRTYADFLGAALSEVDDGRFAAALATTLYQQAAHGKLRSTRIVSTVQNETLRANLLALISCIEGARFSIRRPSKERDRALRALLGLADELLRDKEIDRTRATIANISPTSVAGFINESLEP